MVDHSTIQPSPTSLDAADRAPDQTLERYKAELALWVEQQATFPTKAADLLTVFAQTGLRSLYLVNGGGLVAILALLGNVWGKGDAVDLASRLEPAATYLTSGLIFAFLATAAAYLTQLCFVDFREKKWARPTARWGQAICLALCAASLTLFAWGVLSGISAIGKHMPSTHRQAAWSTIQLDKA